MTSAERIFLVGPAGAGKSTVGRQLAKLLGREFVDSDTVIEQRAGADIPWIFDVEGEAGFRERETQVLQELAARPVAVVATGGGIVLSETNRELLKSEGVVVYLTISLSEQLKRTSRDAKRPLLASGDRRATLEKMRVEREPLYLEVADIKISAAGRSAKRVAQSIVDALAQQLI